MFGIPIRFRAAHLLLILMLKLVVSVNDVMQGNTKGLRRV